MTAELLVDAAWTKPAAAAAGAAGYAGLIGYVSADASKDLTAAVIADYHAHRLGVLLVFETTSTRAQAGEGAGQADRVYAETRASTLGFPREIPIFYAVDEQVAPAVVLPYFRGVHTGACWPVGVYGDLDVVEAVMAAGLATYGWQTCAWSGGRVSQVAHLYQRLTPTRPPIAGVPAGSYDEDVVLRPLPLWTPASPPSAAPAATATPIPAAHPAEDEDMFLFKNPDNAAEYVVIGGVPYLLRAPADVIDLEHQGVPWRNLPDYVARPLAATAKH